MTDPFAILVSTEEDMRTKINEWLDTLHIESLDVHSEEDEDMDDTLITMTITGVPKGK